MKKFKTVYFIFSVGLALAFRGLLFRNADNEYKFLATIITIIYSIIMIIFIVDPFGIYKKYFHGHKFTFVCLIIFLPIIWFITIMIIIFLSTPMQISFM